MTLFRNTHRHGFNRAKQRLSATYLQDPYWGFYVDRDNYSARTQYPAVTFDLGPPRPDRCVLVASFVRYDNPGSPGLYNYYSARPSVFTGTNGEGFTYWVTHESSTYSPDVVGAGIGFVRVPYDTTSDIGILYRQYYNDGVDAYVVGTVSLPTKFNYLAHMVIPTAMSPATADTFFDVPGTNPPLYSGPNSGVSSQTITARGGSLIGVFSVALSNQPCVPDWSNITSQAGVDYYRYANADENFPASPTTNNYLMTDTDGNSYSASLAVFSPDRNIDNFVFCPTWSNDPQQLTIITQIY